MEQKTEWVNNKVLMWKHVVKPCHMCYFCPYGGIVEMFPLHESGSEERSCNVFGHDCPAYYNVEMIREEIDDPCIVQKEIDKFNEELDGVK